MNYKMLYATNHMLMGWLYILVGLVGGSMGYGLSMLLSFELSCSGYVLMSWLQYNSIITFHGIYMIFFMMMPILMGGLGNMLIPLMLFSSDMMFPSVNALSMWLLILSLYWMILAMMVNGGVNSGWTFYVPLSTMNLSSFDLMMFSMHFSGLSSIIGSINFITTMLTRSLKYAMDLYPLSLFPLSILSTSMLLILSVPVLAGCITMILLDSNFNTSFYDPIRGGDCLLFQHLFWFFGHPEVYMLMLPAFGIVSEVLSSASLVSMFGRDSMILAMLMIVVLGSMVWGHHMFMVGFDIDTRAYFTTATSIIAMPTGMKMFNWLATIWEGRIWLTTPMFFIIGFLFSFSFGGFTGLVLANCIIDSLLHDSYFIVGHFHFVLSLGAVYTIFAAFYTYYSLFTSSIYVECIGRLHYITMFYSSNLLFLPFHHLGLLSFPRSMFDYPILYWSFHWFSSIAVMGMSLSILLLCLALVSWWCMGWSY